MKNRIKNFDIQTKLGSGSYGVIYRAVNKLTKEICVLKQISLGRLSEKAKKSAINEATIMGKLVHPFIVRYQESFIEDNTLNIIMEYCDNGDLNHFLKMQNKRPLKEQKIWRFFLQICVGLQYIHKNRILHRDIKSLNIFMNKNEELKIGDLGVAKMLTSNDFAQTMVGTPFYLSPQLCQEKPYNQKSDIWALGCLLYELCTFRHPFEAQNQGSLILKIVRGKYVPIPELYSKDLKEVIDLCLERDYKRRPTTSNLLTRPKIKTLLQNLGINKLVEDEFKKLHKEKQNISSGPKVLKEEKQAIVSREKFIKAVDNQVQKVIKAMDNEPKPTQIKEEIKNIVKKEEPSKKEEKLKKQEPKREPVVILPKPISHNDKKTQQSKNQFVNKLEKLMSEEEKKQNKVVSSKPVYSYPELPIKANDIKKEEKPLRLSEQGKAEIAKNVQIGKSPLSNEPKRYTPVVPHKKSANDAINRSKQQDPFKPPLAVNKPPLPPSANLYNKDHIMKVKNEKVIQPKVYQSQKNVLKPQGIIKSGGFSQHIQVERQQSKEKEEKASRQKPTSAKRGSIPYIKPEKDISSKQLFGPSPTPTPSVQHKSERNLKNPMSVLSQNKPEFKKQEFNSASRVRKGGYAQMARNAKNASRYNTHQITKEEEDLVMNLPTKVTNDGEELNSESEEEIDSKKTGVKSDMKRKSNHNGFQLKEINHDLVLQKYQDMMKSEEQAEPLDQNESPQDRQFEEQDAPREQEMESEQGEDIIVQRQDIVEELEQVKRNSHKSSEAIEQMLDTQPFEQEEGLERCIKDEQYDEEMLKDENRQDEWSFDEQPELPMIEQKQSPFFEPNNPYLSEENDQTTEDKINHLQTKLEQNMKREDQINKLMHIKLDQCRKVVGNEKALQEILQFFRKKFHMEDDFNDDDQKQVDTFLKKKGLTDHNKFQNIYKIMHFEQELNTTRKHIQRICKKLSEMESDL